VIAAVGAGACYLIDGCSYLAVIIGLLAMRLAPTMEQRQVRHPLAEMREGFAYVFGFRPMRVLMITLAIVSAVGFSYSVLTPMVAKDTFHGDARVLGYLMSASGVGALMGAIYLGNRTSIRGLGNVVAFGGALMGLGLVSFSISKSLAISMASLGVVGLGGVLLMASSNTLMQSLVEEDKRGRVMSIFTMSFTGTMPLGNLLVGSVAGTVGPALTFAVAGAICLAVAFVFYRLLPQLRAAAAPLFERLNLVETAS
jgi:predicted MFS family arabinose efflux permease